MPIKNIDTRIPCSKCDGEKAVTHLPDTGDRHLITERCEHCRGTGIEPMPKADVDKGPIRP